ncbi:MAG: tetraacyldisaccharide 4'-kinase [Rhodoferax sp.]
MSRPWQPLLHDALQRSWSKRGALACLLWPVSLLYALLVLLRRGLYQSGCLSAHQVNAVVVVVGNVVTGGAGKTPTVLAVVQHFRQQGYRVGIVSRGYGRKHSDCLEVSPDADPQAVGDEPLLLRRRSDVPVFVAARRHDAAQALMARHPQTQIIVCDDGLQHYSLYRDVEICVFDHRGFGNGWLLPAGLLREHWPRRPVKRIAPDGATALVLCTAPTRAVAGFSATRTLAAVAQRRDGTTLPLQSLRQAGAKPLIALAGIGQPEAFFAMLRAEGLPLADTLALPDHYAFDSIPSRLINGAALLCTEKDASKLWRIAPEALAVPLDFQVEPAFFSELDARIRTCIAARLSSSHGHKTT